MFDKEDEEDLEEEKDDEPDFEVQVEGIESPEHHTIQVERDKV